MDKKKIVKSYQGLIHYLPKLGRKDNAKWVAKVLDAAVPIMRTKVMGFINLFPEIARYPEMKDESYLPPAGYTMLFMMAAIDPDTYMKVFGDIVKKSGVKDPRITALALGHHALPIMLSRYLKHHQAVKFAVSEDVMEKSKLLGDPLDFPIDELIDAIQHPHLFVCEDGNIFMLYKTLYYRAEEQQTVEVLRIEKVGGLLGTSFFDVYKVKPEMDTLRTLYDYYRNDRLEMIDDGTPTEAMDEASEILPLLMLTLSNNITLPKPVELNELREAYLLTGHHDKAKRHESYRFIDLEQTTFQSRKPTSEGSAEPSSSKAPHARSGHFRRQRIGSRDDWKYKTIWIAPTVVHGGADVQNKVFRVIQL
jgi:hypothetical protein